MKMHVRRKLYPLREAFVLNRGTVTHALVVQVELRTEIAGVHYVGRGECCPVSRYGESDVSEMLRLWWQYFAVRRVTEPRLLRKVIQKTMRAGAARNALDCALWDIEARMKGMSVWDMLQHDYADLFNRHTQPAPLTTLFTISLDTPDAMRAQAERACASGFTYLKLKLGATRAHNKRHAATDAERLDAVTHVVQTRKEKGASVRLFVDANEGWPTDTLSEYTRLCREAGVELLEQPLPEGKEEWGSIPDMRDYVCADESFHTSADVPTVAPLYGGINIKLDKCGGLTEALECMRAARAAGLRTMVGSMVGTSLSHAPAFYLAQAADYVDLDTAYFIRDEGENAMEYKDGKICAPLPALWGA
jgi:L-alanine-DL-glutamate epimerase-like enolase superfamily enzyme